MLDFWTTFWACLAAVVTVKTLVWLGGLIVASTLRSVDGDVEWRTKTGAPLFDTAGEIVECEHRLAEWVCKIPINHEGMHSDSVMTWDDFGYCWPLDDKPSSSPLPNRVAEPIPTTNNQTEVVANVLSPVGFVVVNVRVDAAYQDEAMLDSVCSVVDVAAERLRRDLVPCEEAGCGRVGGQHWAECPEVKIDMGAIEMMGQERQDDEV